LSRITKGEPLGGAPAREGLCARFEKPNLVGRKREAQAAAGFDLEESLRFLLGDDGGEFFDDARAVETYLLALHHRIGPDVALDVLVADSEFGVPRQDGEEAERERGQVEVASVENRPARPAQIHFEDNLLGFWGLGGLSGLGGRSGLCGLGG